MLVGPAQQKIHTVHRSLGWLSMQNWRLPSPKTSLKLTAQAPENRLPTSKGYGLPTIYFQGLRLVLLDSGRVKHLSGTVPILGGLHDCTCPNDFTQEVSLCLCQFQGVDMYLPFLFQGNKFLRAQAQETHPKEIPGVKLECFWGSCLDMTQVTRYFLKQIWGSNRHNQLATFPHMSHKEKPGRILSMKYWLFRHPCNGLLKSLRTWVVGIHTFTVGSQVDYYFGCLLVKTILLSTFNKSRGQ